MARRPVRATRLFVVESDDPPSKRAVLTAALKLFVERGVAGTTVRDIANEAGFTNPVIFKYFDGRDALAAFIFERCVLTFSSLLAEASRGGAPFETRLARTVRLFAEVIDDDLDAFLFVQDNLRVSWPASRAELRAHSPVRLVRELFSGAPRPGGVGADADLLTTVFLGTMAQYARFKYFGDLPGRAVDRCPDLETLFLNLIRARAA